MELKKMACNISLLLILSLVSSFVSLTSSFVVGHERNVVTYDADTLGAGLEKSRNFIMFYAGWSEHCDTLSPTWDELATMYNKGDNSEVIIAKIDCVVHGGLCLDHQIIHFPTLQFYQIGGETYMRFTGKYTIESLNIFIQEMIQEVPKGKVTDITDTTEPQESLSKVVLLTQENFDTTVATGLYFVMFFIHQCPHSMRLVPTWEELAEAISANVTQVAMVDCELSTLICKHQEIKEYPTLWFFRNGQKIGRFQGSRNVEALKQFVAEKSTEEPEVFVKELTDVTFQAELATGLVFVKFYAPWCGNCKRFAPTWATLSRELHGHPVSIARLDCSQYKSLCDEHEISKYPTLKIFRYGYLVASYKGERTMVDLQNFVEKHTEL